MVSLILALIVGGVWSVYYAIVNTYYEEQSGAAIEAEGQWILDLLADGGNFKGRRIYGLSSALREDLNVGQTDTKVPNYSDSDDYRIGFTLDGEDVANRRYAEFAVEFNGEQEPTSKLYFRLGTEEISDSPSVHNYEVLISKNLLQRKAGTDPEAFGNYEKTWFKAQELPKEAGVKVSFYLADTTRPLEYNYCLDRKLLTPINDPVQRSRFLGSVPHPRYFSRVIHFPNSGS
jgi:hypothetical protein